MGTDTEIRAALEKCAKIAGKGVVKRGSIPPVVRISCGIKELDEALCGGLPQGRIIDICGPEAAGKTYIAMKAAAWVQQSGGNVVWIDADYSLDKRRAQACGVNDELIVVKPDNLEMVYDTAIAFAADGKADMIVIDTGYSIAEKSFVSNYRYTSVYEDEGKEKYNDITSKAMSILSKYAARNSCTVIITSLIYDKLGVLYGCNEVPTSGRAILHYSSIRIDVRRMELLTNQGKIIGNCVKARIVKSKVSPMFRETYFNIIY